MTVSWGMLSTARINDCLLEAARRTDRVQFDAVGGRDAARAAAWAEPRNVERSYGSYEQLLADPEIEVIYISVPNGLHLRWATAALEAGKHVLCEKPLGSDPSRVAAVASLAEKRGLIFAEAFMYRYHPQTKIARELVARGEIGKLRQINASMTFSIEDREGDDIRLSAELDGGSLMDVGCYCVSALRLFAGEPELAFADFDLDGAEVDIRVNGLFRFSDGATGQFDAAMNLPRRDRLELVGEDASIILNDPWHCRLPSIEVRRPRSDTDGPPAPGEGTELIAIDPDCVLGLREDLFDTYRLEIEAFSAAVETGKPPEFAGADAVSQARAVEAVVESARSGRPVKLSTVEEGMK